MPHIAWGHCTNYWAVIKTETCIRTLSNIWDGAFHKENNAWVHLCNLKLQGPGGLGGFLDTLSVVYILNGKFNPKMDTSGPFFPKSEHFFWFSKRVGKASHLPPSCALVSVAEYASNIPEYA